MRDIERDIAAWAEDNGSYGRCPSCRRRIWVESGCRPECSCGFGEDKDTGDDD